MVSNIYSEDIYNMALKLGQTASERLVEFSKAAEVQLKNLIKEEVSIEDCQDIFILSAALLAMSMDLIEDAGEVYSYAVGSVSVTGKTQETTSKKADNLRRQAEILMAPYVNDGYFNFRGIKG